MKTFPIYPKLSVQRHILDGSEHVLTTSTLRKKHKGIWYLVDIVDKVVIREGDTEALVCAINYFHELVYSNLVAGIVSPEMKRLDGLPYFMVDDNQQEETKRICPEL